MPKEIDLEKMFYPHANILRKVDNFHEVTIVDAELDAIECSYLGDDCVMLDVSNFTYITLTRENLKIIKKYLDKLSK